MNCSRAEIWLQVQWAVYPQPMRNSDPQPPSQATSRCPNLRNRKASVYYTKLLNLESVCFTAIDNTKAKAEGNGFNYLVKHTFGFAPLASDSDPGNNCIHPNSFLVHQQLSFCLGVGIVCSLFTFISYLYWLFKARWKYCAAKLSPYQKHQENTNVDISDHDYL